MKLIILDAGDAFELDGFNKLFIRHPVTKKRIIDNYLDIFAPDNVEIVVGYKAIQVVNEYPDFKYIYNKDWQTTGSAYSMSLALTNEPCYIVSSDLFISGSVVDQLNRYDNCVVVKNTENRRLSSLNAVVKDGRLMSVYRGKSRNNNPEFMNIIKITDADMLAMYRKKSAANQTSYAGETLPFECDKPINLVMATNSDVYEINTPADYINFLERARA